MQQDAGGSVTPYHQPNSGDNMFHPTMRKLAITTIITLLLTPLLAFNGDWIWSQPKDGSIRLAAPPFLNSAQAQTMSIFDNEAGIAAYFNAGRAITLTDSNLQLLYRSSATPQNGYLLGSAIVSELPNSFHYYSANDDPQLYISAEGWVMAYYTNFAPTSKIIDWSNWDGNGTLPTKLGQVLSDAAARIGVQQPTPTYYHFKFPNANHMMLIADNYTADNVLTNSFNFTPPTSFQYSEWSWSLASLNTVSVDISYELNGTQIVQVRDSEIQYGTFSSTQIVLGNPNIVTIRSRSAGYRGASGLAVIYKVP